MAREAGVVKSLTGKAVAVDQNGNARELKVGDIVYIGESIKTSDAADKVTIVANNGKEITILGDDTLALNQNTIGSDGLADVSALQNAILNGGDLTKLEETAAGGNAAAAGGGDGVSLSDARFAEGGHYSNINENYRNLTDANRAFASYDSPIGGYSDGNANGGDLIPPKPSVSVEFKEDRNNDGFLTYTENENDSKQNESPVTITATNVIPGDILHIKLTKPDGTVESLSPITINATDIVNNTFTKIISDMPVAEGKISKVEAHITDSANTIKSNKASDSVTPYERPTIRFTEDKDDNGFLTDAENKGTDENYENFRTSPVEITLPKGVVAGDKIVITYTDPLNPTGTKELAPIELTDKDITNHKVTGIEVPIFPGLETKASVHVVDKDGSQKTEKSSPDSVTPQTIKMDMSLPEQKTLHEISRQESVSSYFSNYEKPFDGVKINPGDQRVNHTTAKITLPNRIDDGDRLTLHVTKPDGNTYDRNFKINMNEKGVITSVDEIDSAGHTIGNPYNTANKNFFKEDTNQWAIKVDGFELENGKDTKIKAEVTHPTHPTNQYLPTEENSKSASLEYVKKPEVIFEEAGGAKTMTREQAIGDGNLNSTTVTIKLPKNAVNGDKINVTIKNPDGTTEYKHYTVEKDATGKLTGITNNDNASDHVTIKNGNSFEIPGIKTATGVKTEVTAEIVDNDGSIQHAENSSSVMIAGLNDMAVRFVEDSDHNVSLTRAESKDGDNKLDETTIAVKVPNNVIAGDMVNVTINGASPKTYEVKGRDEHGKIILKDTSDDTLKTVNDKNEFEIKGVHIEAGKPINVTAETTDASGGKKAEATNHNTLEKLHDDMKITFDKDIDNDGILGSTEATTGTTTMTTIKLPSNIVDGDKLIINSKTGANISDDETYTIQVKPNGVVYVKKDDGSNTYLPVINNNEVNEVKYPLTNLQNGEKTIINARVTGAAGDVSKTKSDIILDTGNGSGTRFRLLIDEDKDRNGWLDREEAMKDGQLKTTSATLEIPNTVNNGDVITITATGKKDPEIYTVEKDVSGKISLKGAGGNIVHLPSDNKLQISDVHLVKDNPDKDYLAKVDVTIKDHVTGKEKTATAEAKLETFDATNLKVEFKEDNASRDGKIDRDEAVSDGDVKSTTISVQVPYNVINDDKITVTINQPGDSTPRTEIFKVVKDASGNISLKHNGAPYPFTNNTFEIHDVKMLPGQETTATAKITNAAGDMSETSPEAKAKLAPLSEAGLSVSIAADKNGDGVISRDELDEYKKDNPSNNTSKVKVSIPGNVIKGDKIDVEITNPDNSQTTKHYEVIGKDVNGNITLKDVTDPNNSFIIVDENNDPKKFNASNPLELDAAIAVGKDKDTVAKVTLTDADGNFPIDQDGNEIKYINVKAHAEIDAIRGIRFVEDTSRDNTLQGYENSKDQDTTPIQVYLNEDARVGDTVEIKYTDPDNHAQTKPVNHVLTADDISKGSFEQSLDINARSAYDLKVDATFKTSKGLETKLPTQTLHIETETYTIKYDASKTMKGGDSDNDTLVVDGQTIDFSKVEKFENIQLKGNSKITINAQDVLDITDSDKVLNILNIKGSIDNQGNKTTSVKLDGNWEENTPTGVTDYKTYKSDDVIGHTIQIKIDDTVHIL
ncbi:retention module-containing protein [Campylobacter concisus]|uniref:retention module-containing protein n=1 Tax=Campylobacter concisus TaxID=199 RepID=UPI000CD81021|nr:retention module-containing protein [Campylobacter concisus]